MRETVFVISDLHLGGDDQFAICTGEGQRLLAEFLQWVATRHSAENPVHLVVNGDSVDFLAEREFAAFTVPDSAATAKLNSIFNRTKAVWDGFRAVLAAGAKVTFTLGNHDLELSLPGPRRLLKERLGKGEFEFIYDNQALAIGDVLIEHGNRYDRWNVINHDALRHARVQASLGRELDEFDSPPGSRLVIDVMNGLKERYSFVNLLKPENEAAVPMLAVLDPGVFENFPALAALNIQASEKRRQRDEIAAHIDLETTALHPDDQRAIDVARDLAFGTGKDQISSGVFADLFARLKASVSEAYREQQIDKIYKAFRYWLGPQLTTFDTGQEAKEYHNSAVASARNGFKMILYGHTHLAKRMPLPINSATYLNTGTFADLICVPHSILLSDSEAQAKKDLDVFVRDLENNRLDKWTSRIPTFAQIEMADGHAQSGDLFVFHSKDKIARLKDGVLSSLLVPAQTGANA
ncbi:MAG: metallophosphoesterase [Bryobacterales bacterium]|nr:metallophosphoesterase [Bryobacterales bacterium]